MKKKIITLILALSVTYCMFGCGETPEQEKTEQLMENKTRSDTPELKVNQIGYQVNGEKMAVASTLADDDMTFTIIDVNSGETVFEGEFTDRVDNIEAGEFNSIANFSAFTKEGTYKLMSEKGVESYEFTIGDSVYDDTFDNVVKMFYLQRCGEELSADYAGDFAHPSCHGTEAVIYGTEKKIDVSGGWHDAGDYGRYVVPGAKAAADLMLAYEKNAAIFTDDMGIPESGNGVSDILDEVRYELEWMLKMQNSDNGGVYHKVTCEKFPGVLMPQKETNELIITPISNTATGDFAASMAMASRIYADVDSDFSEKCLDAAKKAFSYLKVSA